MAANSPHWTLGGPEWPAESPREATRLSFQATAHCEMHRCCFAKCARRSLGRIPSPEVNYTDVHWHGPCQGRGMKTYRHLFSPRESRLARLFLAGFALSLAPLGAQTAGSTAASSSSSANTAPGTSPSAVTSPTGANTSFYNTPNSSSVNSTTHTSGGTYIPNNSGPTGSVPKVPSTAVTPTTPTGTTTVNAGGTSGSAQTAGTTSPSSP